MQQQQSQTINKTKRPWWKKLLVAVMWPTLLILIAAVVLSLLGNEAADSMSNTVERLWLPSTLFRLGVYLVIAFLIAPQMLKRLINKNAQDIDLLEAELERVAEALPTDNELTHLIDRAKVQGRIYLCLRKRKWILLIILLGFDLLTVQLPYLLR